MNSFFELLNTRGGIVVAALIGAVLGLGNGQGTPLQRVLSGFTGMAAAIYITPIVLEFSNFDSPAAANGLAFLIGYFGKETIDWAIRIGKSKAEKTLGETDLEE